jgi:4-amino-4-deoxy-L-arabinose transferase-like glycosyltransferase
MIGAVIKKTTRGMAALYLLLGVTALLTLFFRLGSLPFVGNDECRYARISEEMSQAGRWVTPVLQGLPWLEKPPLYYWITIASYRVFGVSEAAARYGPALCALLSSLAVLWLGSRLWSRRTGFLAGLIMLTSIGFCAFGRSATPDMPMTTCFTLACVLLAAALLAERAPAWGIWAAYACLGLSVLAKGPVAFVLGAGILMLFWTLDEQGGCFRKLRILPGAAVALAVALPWHWLAFKENGFSFIASFFINHNFARYVTDVHHHEQPLVYFVPIMLGLLFPWSGWLPAFFRGRPRLKSLDMRAWDRSTLLLTCWALFPFLFFSLSSSKLPGYVLPSLPPLALLLARELTRRMDDPAAAGRLRITPWIYLLLSAGSAIALPVLMWRSYEDSWHAGLVLGAITATAALVVFWLAKRNQLCKAVCLTAMQGAVLLLAVTQFGFAPLAEYNSAHEIAGKALEASSGTIPIVTFSYFDHTLLYYTGYRIDANITDPHTLLEYARQHPDFLVVTLRQLARDIDKMPELASVELCEQGKLRLLKVRMLRE